MIRTYGVREIYVEGLSEDSVPDFRLRVELLRTMAKAVLDDKDRALQRLTRLEAGVVARLLEEGAIDNALPLESQQALQDAKPVKAGKIEFDADAIHERRKAMVKQLPAQGLAVIVLGGSHDLTRYLPEGTQYIRVKVKGYPGE